MQSSSMSGLFLARNWLKFTPHTVRKFKLILSIETSVASKLQSLKALLHFTFSFKEKGPWPDQQSYKKLHYSIHAG
jgi:hypothetical protein